MLHRHTQHSAFALHCPSAGAIAGLLALATLTACADPPTSVGLSPREQPSLAAAPAASQFLIIGSNGVLPANLAAQVSAAGGTLDHVIPQIGVAVATGLATKSIVGADAVVSDPTVDYVQPSRIVDLDDASVTLGPQVASTADDDRFYPLQWAPGAVHAPEAWNAGITGAGVRVAVLDGGLYDLHPDLAGAIDAAASRSFVPPALTALWDWNRDIGTFWHGTHVAGIIGARDNTIGVVGIAPNATLIGVKVLHGGSGQFSWLLDALVYASTPVAQGGAGAQVINMSLGGYIVDAKNPAYKAEVKDLAKAVDRATRYADGQGTTIIAAAGNNASNLDVNKTDLNLPGMSARVIGVAATAPVGWAYGNTNFSRQTSYTNSGKAAVTLAAPGGDFVYPGNENCTMPIVSGTITRPCWVFDLYLSTSRSGYTWAAGTSMASPVVAGIAALVIQANGGLLSPASVRAKLLQGAIDLGQPGNDPVYGQGFVNAYNSVTK